jgi:hypothetical protein
MPLPKLKYVTLKGCDRRFRVCATNKDFSWCIDEDGDNWVFGNFRLNYVK